MELQLAKGVKDTGPQEKIVQQKIVDVLRRIFELYGYVPLDTPILERLDVLSAKYAGGAEILKETFKLKDQGGRDLALRYDLTVPFARYVGMNKDLKLPFKRYQIGEVFRDGPIKLGRYRQFWQCDIDAVGVKSMKIDAEFIEVFNKAFDELGLKVEVKVNNRKILDDIMKKIGVQDGTDIVLILDKLKKVGEQEVNKELQQKGLDDKKINYLLRLMSLKGTNKQKIVELRKELGDSDGLKEIEEITKYNNEFTFDVSLARGLTYYTGTIYEVYLKNNPIKSSVASGGRYDKMVGEFLGTKQEYPAVGISFGLSVICDAIKKENKKTNTQVYVIPIKVNCTEIIRKLRDSEINTDLDYSDKGVSRNLDYASKLGIPYTLIIGEKEVKSKKFTLRDMKTGKERKLALTQIIKLLK